MREFLLTIGTWIAAFAASFLPRRHWRDFSDLPIARFALFSAIVTIIAGTVFGIGGLIQHSRHASRELATLQLKIATSQAQGKIRSDAAHVAPLVLALYTPISFWLFTPLGLASTYLIFSGATRALTCIGDDPMGDPILSGLDWLVHRAKTARRHEHDQRLREELEGIEVPDRLYPAEWANVSDADLVVVASRRKPDWDKGTFIVTTEKWYVVGEPFSMDTHAGLRTVYPLKEHTTLDVMRRGVAYELPPLSTRKRFDLDRSE